MSRGVIITLAFVALPICTHPQRHAWDWYGAARSFQDVLTAPDEAQIIVCLADFLGKSGRRTSFWANGHRVSLPESLRRETGAERINTAKQALSQTTSGMVLARCVFTLAFYDIPGAGLPLPRRDALRDYFSRFLFYDFRPDLFWPHYPANWQMGMRNVLRHAIETGYEVENVNHAICLLPLFFSEAQAGRIYDLVSIIKAVNYDTGWQGYRRLYHRYNTYWHREGLRFWLNAVWAAADEQRREELVDALYMVPLTDPRGLGERYRIPAPQLRHTVYFREDLVPVREWLKEHPAKLNAYLEHQSHHLKQQTLMLALAKEDGLIDPREPRIIELMLEGLRDDDVAGNHRVLPHALAKYSTHTLPATRRTYRTTQDLQQKLLLTDLLITLNDKPSRNDVLEFLYGMLAERNSSLLPAWVLAKERDWPISYRGRIRWVCRRLLTMGVSARDYLLERMLTSNDPQQVALSLLLLKHLKGLRFVRWDERLVQILARGLENNENKYDQGYCAAALKLGKPEALETFRRIAANAQDEQLRISAEVLIPYLRGDLAEYTVKKLKYGGVPFRYSRGQRRYWEYASETNWAYWFRKN